MSDEKKMEIPKIEVQIDGDSINAYLAKAILDSNLGPLIKKHVEEAVSQADRWGDNPVKQMIQQEVRHAIERVVLEKQDEIREMVVKQITPETIGSLARAIVEKVKTSY